MAKFPLLEMLRAERERHEAEVSQPYREQIDGLSRVVEKQRASIRAMESLLGSKIAEAMADQIAHSLSAEVRRLIFQAVAKATGTDGKPVTMTFPADVVRFSNPNSIEREVLERFLRDSLPSLSLSVEANPKDYVTVVDVRVPQLGYRTSIAAH